MTTGNYFVVCTLVGKPCGSNNQADKTAKAETINHQVTGRSESYQTEHDAMVATILTTDVTMTTLPTQLVNTVATSPITNNTTTNTVRVNNTITSNGSSVTNNCTVSITTAATSVTNSSTSIDSMASSTSSTTFPNPSATTYPKTTGKGQTFNACFVSCTTAQSSGMPAGISVCLWYFDVTIRCTK